VISHRERARLLLLRLARAELECRFDDAALLRPDVARALDEVAIGTEFHHVALAHDTLSVANMLHLALQCVVMRRCSCGLEIDGTMWRSLPVVGVQHSEEDDGALYELRNCLCGTTLSVAIPEMRERVATGDANETEKRAAGE
jgi:hypothetical protein